MYRILPKRYIIAELKNGKSDIAIPDLFGEFMQMLEQRENSVLMAPKTL